jgi:hypothetical protein
MREKLQSIKRKNALEEETKDSKYLYWNFCVFDAGYSLVFIHIHLIYWHFFEFLFKFRFLLLPSSVIIIISIIHDLHELEIQLRCNFNFNDWIRLIWNQQLSWKSIQIYLEFRAGGSCQIACHNAKRDLSKNTQKIGSKKKCENIIFLWINFQSMRRM